ncbi:MAG: hypothetical protein R3D68_17810 [Hyphomicrobiaceae bacterium]
MDLVWRHDWKSATLARQAQAACPARGPACAAAAVILALVLLLLAIDSVAASGPARDDDAKALARFHQALQDLERGRRRHVAVLQIGDSHTAADHLSGRLRRALQGRFGNAGRGFLPPGVPYAYYRPDQIRVTQTHGWVSRSSNKKKPDAEPFGLSGQLARASAPEDVITIELTHHVRVAALAVGIVKEPGGGALEVVADDSVIATLPTASEVPAQVRVELGLSPGTRRIALRPFGDGPVAIADHTLIGARRGVTLSNLGFSGAQVGIMSRWDWPRAAAQIADVDPSLIILAFGTNEGFSTVAAIRARYARAFEQRLAALMAAAPNASIAIVGPPDANRFFRYCRPHPKPPEPPRTPAANDGAPSPDARSGPATTATSPLAARAAEAARPVEPDPADTAPCHPLTADERRDYDELARAEDRGLCRWHTPAALPLVREIQREIARRRGVLFFDWSALTERECGADRWFRQGLIGKDRVHFQKAGYWRTADALYARLLAGYRRPVR